MEKKALAIIIPTYNRLDCVKYYLDTQLEAFQNCGIDVVIYDSSEDSEVRDYVLKLCESGFQNLIYKHYHGEKNTRAIDEKVFSACREMCSDYEYIWFSSDGTVFQIENLWLSISNYIKCRYDVIVLNHINARNEEDKYYCDSKTLLHDCGWILTMLGAGIVSTKVMEETMKQFPTSSKKNFWLWYPLAYFYLFAERPIKAVWLGCQNVYLENPFRTDAFWKVNGDALWQWGEVWVESIEALPGFYDDVKDDVIRSWDAHAHLFSVKGILGMKAQGQISFSDVIRYKKYLGKITDTKPIWFYIITLFGNQRALSWVRKIYREMKEKRAEKP